MSPLRLLRLVVHLVRMNVMLTVEYRVGFFIIMVNTVAGPAVALLIWLAVAEHGVGLPYSRQQFVTYFVLMGLVSMATASWTADYVAAEIRDGSLSEWLIRPAPNVLHYLANNLGEKAVKLGLLLPVVATVAAVLWQDVRLPAEPGRWLLAGAALFLSAILAFMVDYLVGCTAFWLQDSGGVAAVERLLYGLLAGQFIPLAMFPPWTAGFLEAQPWRYTLSFPLEILTGALDPPALLRGFAWQALYCLGALAAYRLVWRAGLRAYAATGT